MEHRHKMSPKQVETALECAYGAASDTDFNEAGAALLIGSTNENAEEFRNRNQASTGSHDVDIMMMPKPQYDLGEFFNEFSSFWRNYDENAREEGMHTSTYSDSNHETQANWITEQTEGAEGKIPGHALLFPSEADIKNHTPQGFYQAVKDQHIPLYGSLDQVNQEPTPRRLGDFISEYHGPSGPLISDSFPEEVQWRTLEQIVEYTEEHYGELVDDSQRVSEIDNEIQQVAQDGLETAQQSPQELHSELTSSLSSNKSNAIS